MSPDPADAISGEWRYSSGPTFLQKMRRLPNECLTMQHNKIRSQRPSQWFVILISSYHSTSILLKEHIRISYVLKMVNSNSCESISRLAIIVRDEISYATRLCAIPFGIFIWYCNSCEYVCVWRNETWTWKYQHIVAERATSLWRSSHINDRLFWSGKVSSAFQSWSPQLDSWLESFLPISIDPHSTPQLLEFAMHIHRKWVLPTFHAVGLVKVAWIMFPIPNILRNAPLPRLTIYAWLGQAENIVIVSLRVSC